MSGRIDLDQAGKRLRITFPYHPSLVDIVRGFEGRRFVKQERAWTVPAAEVVSVVDTLRARHFDVSPEVMDLYEETAGEALPEAPAPNRETLSISDLNRRARKAIIAAFEDRVWVVGEITGFDRWSHKRHVHFQLTEKQPDRDDQLATVNAVLFADARERIDEILRQAREPFELHDGIEVRVLVRVDLYAPLGAFQVVVDEIDPVHTLGVLAQRRRMILEELERRSLVDRNRAMMMPLLPLRIGLVTSLGSDAYNDFVNELEASGYAFEITVCDTVMQGPRLEAGLCATLRYLAGLSDEFDLVVITRGGGARADLAWFDTLDIALAVARHPVKIITAIGHHRDISVIDVIAQAVKTPTAAAGLLIETVREAEHSVLDQASRTVQLARRRLSAARHDLTEQARAVRRSAQSCLHDQRARVLRVSGMLPRRAARSIEAARRTLSSDTGRLGRSVRTVLQAGGVRLRVTSLRLAASGRACLRGALRDLWQIRRVVTGPRLFLCLKHDRERLDGRAAKLRALDPHQVLARGYALARKESGEILRRPTDVENGEAIRIHLAEGRVDARVTAREANGERTI